MTGTERPPQHIIARAPHRPFGFSIRHFIRLDACESRAGPHPTRRTSVRPRSGSRGRLSFTRDGACPLPHRLRGVLSTFVHGPALCRPL